MFSSKFIKLLCKIALFCVYAFAIFCIVYGVKNTEDGNSVNKFFVLIGVLIPIFATISIYPLFALANIDENLSLLNEKMDIKLENDRRYRYESTEKEKTHASKNNNEIEENIVPVNKKQRLTQDVVDFINERYNISLTLDDDVETIKIKITNINEKLTTAEMLKNKVLSANSEEAIFSALNMHKAIYG